MTYSSKSEIHSYGLDAIFKIVEPIVVGTKDGKRTISTTVTTDKGIVFNISFEGDIIYVSK